MKKLVFLYLLFCSINIFSQGEANFWYFGKNAGINFNSGTPVPITGKLNTNEGCSSFSDKNGNLLFYSDGITVWNRNNNSMPNGVNLKGDPSSTQSAIIVPHPGKTNIYYLFTVGANNYDQDGNLISATEGLQCYTIDMTANGGLGDVIGSAIDLSNGQNANWTEKITSVKGADCNSYWVISLVKNTFITYKIDNTGLITAPVISTVNYTSQDPRGYLKVSPSGKKLASATFGVNGNFLLYSFNDTTGTVSNDGISLISNVAIDGQVYGVEFSPLSTKLYCSTFNFNSNKIYQFNLEASNIVASKTLINSQFGYRGALQLAPNGKIYATVPADYNTGTSYIDAINFPEKLGLNCNYQEKALDLGTNGFAMQGLPPFISSILLPIEITDGITTENLNKTVAKRCLGESYKLASENIAGNVNYKWIFKGNVISNNATLDMTNLSNSMAGVYYLEAETIDNCGFKILYKGEVTIEVYAKPILNTATSILKCDSDGINDGFYSVDFNTITTAQILNGQSSTNFEVLYFNNQIDADLNQNALPNPYTNKTAYGTEIIYARIQNVNSPLCYQTTSFVLQIFETSYPPSTITNLSLCDSSISGTDIDGIEIFDLTSKNLEILNGQDASKFTIAYFTDAAYTNKIPNPTSFKNSIRDLQPIYVKINNKLNLNCITTTSFNIVVHVLPSIQSNFTIKQCDEDGIPDGYTDFNLNEANNYLSNGISNLKITYYLTYNDALLDSNAVIAAPFSNAIQNKVLARIENSNGCFRVAQLNLLVSSTSFPENYLKKVIQCDDDATFDGKNLFDLAYHSSEIINLFPTGQNLEVSYYRNLKDAQLEQNKIPTSQPYLNEIPYNQTLYVRVESEDNGECFGLGPYLNLTVNPRPDFNIPETAIYCKNLPPITVLIFNANGLYTYEWKNENGQVISNSPKASINKEGTYTVIATSNEGCASFPQTIEVSASEIAAISYNDIKIIDDSDNNSITISTENLGIGDYEFSLDNMYGNYQTEPYFENVEAGIHTVFVKDNFNCGIAQIEVSVIGYPKFFTPNNDGINDTWRILGVSDTFYVNSTIYIFNRYGKLITQINPKSEGWNGIYNGQYLPATDYWFSVELIDNNGEIRIRKGHFSLIR
ncbi:T9SS type B sorting domain-containing protein [Lutibacter sp.]|uniref:T9SS type B sorting domain-containing protein n=1 Tax=Lutibacter sp. TaxID=1925666 RepID=UPI001A29D75C|nr:T9SS type B sorting domain-containing protein [Lutibacter sp.]MBI9041293.1 T9SS type B sorting domain-containing protein [Lutibacter sp.]